MHIDIFLIIFLSVVLIIAAIIDYAYLQDSQPVNLPGHADSTNLPYGDEWYERPLIFSSLGLLVGILLFSIPFFYGDYGRRRRKLMGAVGAVLGLRGVLNASLFTAVAGGIFALILLLSHYRDFRFVTRAVENIQASLAAKCYIRCPWQKMEETKTVLRNRHSLRHILHHVVEAIPYWFPFMK